MLRTMLSRPAVAGSLLCAAITVLPAHADSDGDRDGYSIGLWGDLPYSDEQVSGVRNVIASARSATR